MCVSSVESKLEAMGLTLPPVPRPVAAYVPWVLHQGTVYVSGQIPTAGGELRYRGKVGAGLTLEEGYQAARLCALNALAVLKAALGDLDRVGRVVKVTGYVNSAPDFTDHPKVINGASELLAEVFGERGRHARAAVGVAALPLGAATEVELVAAVRE